ncbi:hypothetical protein PG996_015961 [Apiospora saccharicola]|uniref:AB hydrolase-1 domain-containing protein n=1 Tax=Apiospora saccharicola TaxID=335842 RepID=A0ABR1TMS3_9PEZI
MAVSYRNEEIEFTTLDGLTLRGTLFPASKRGAAVIMTPGFNLTRRTLFPKVASNFQQHGITALVYDPRTLGSSDGSPRNNIDPAEQVADYHDALTYLKSDSRVDPHRIAFWGMSFSGAVALTAAALDPRAPLVIAVCPLTVWELPAGKLHGVLAKAMQDRESQVSGNPPFSLPMIDEADGQNPAGFGEGSGAHELALVQRSLDELPDFALNTTLQTYYNIVAWTPFAALRLLSDTPTLLVTPQDDRISPAAKQRALIYDKLEGTKEMYLVPDAGHMDVLDGSGFDSVMRAQVEFIHQHLHE